jgi:sulfide:quinone oxidoreductase
MPDARERGWRRAPAGVASAGMPDPTSRHLRVLIAGGGPAALEAALALHRHAGPLVSITLLAPRAEFVYRPLAVIEPFELGRSPVFDLAAIAGEHGWSFELGAVAAVDSTARIARCDDGRELPYDELLLAVGADALLALPGALAFRGPEDAQRLGDALRALDRARHLRVVFAVPTATAWTLPAYELAMLTTHWAQEHGVDLEAWVVTHEPRALAVFGPQVAEEVAGHLEHAGVRLWTDAEVESVEDGRLWVAMEGAMPVDLAVGLPRPAARRIAGLPADEAGFVPADEHGRVSGVAHVYAAGDMTSRPLKQGGLAAQQADAAAAAIAVAAGAEPPAATYRPALHGMLLTGADTAWLLKAPGRTGVAAHEPLWWPPHKIAGRELASYLAARTMARS